MDKNGILRCGDVQMLSIKVPYRYFVLEIDILILDLLQNYTLQFAM